MNSHSFNFANTVKTLKIAGKVISLIFRLSMTALWTVCILSGGEAGLAAIGAGIIFFGFSAIIG